MELISLVERLLRAAWGLHFRIPELVYWPVLGVGLWLIITDVEMTVGAAVAAVALVGIGRWKWHRWQSRGGLVVARFSTSPGQWGRDDEAQRVILTSLRDRLPPPVARRVHGIPVVIGPDDRDFALRLRRRLRADFLLHGRIADSSDGGWSVYARVMQPVTRALLHADWHTRDVTPARPRWGPLVDRLIPARNVLDEEYPFEFASELQAIVRGTAGQLALDFEDYGRAEQLLREAIGISPESTSHQVDKLRADLARSIAAQSRQDEALQILRERASGENPSPELLRAIHRLLFLAYPYGNAPREADAEALAALRRAAENQTDPQRPITLYNLLQMVFHPDQENEEAAQLLDELLTDPYYRRAWYIKRHRGMLAWFHSERLHGRGDEEAARREAKEAAKWYSRAIWARPKVRFLYFDGPRLSLIRRFPRSVILHANALDAHARAGRRLRAWRHKRVATRLRWKRFGMGVEAFHRGDWDAAYANADWSIVGWGDDTELVASVYRCIALRQRGEAEVADEYWEELRGDSRLVAFAQEIALRHHLPRGLPGA